MHSIRVKCVLSLSTLHVLATTISAFAVLVTFFLPLAYAAQPAEYAVVIVIDGCRPDYLRLAPLPNIEELARRGVAYESAWVGQLPTNTPPSHATLGTGVFPSHHGVVGFRWKEPTTGVSSYPCSLKHLRRGTLLKIIDDAGVPSVFGQYKTVHSDGVTLAMSSVKPYAALGMGTSAADIILFTPGSKKSKSWGEEGIEKGQIRFFEASNGQGVEEQILSRINEEIKPYENPGDFDKWVVDAFLHLFEDKRPAFSMLNLPEVDEMGHACGGKPAPDVMRPVIQNVDKQIGRIMDAFKAAGIFDKTLFVVTADHGMVPNTYNVSLGSYAAAFLKPSQLIQMGDTTPFLWLRDSHQAKRAAENIARISPAGVDGVFYNHREGGAPRYQNAAASGNPLNERAWSYLLDTIACPSSPDLFLRLTEDTVIGRKLNPNSRGKHYQGTWGTHHIPLIFSGPGVPSGGLSRMPARFVDIPPTLLTLLGVEPSGMDGVILADAMEHPSIAQVELQKSTSLDLAAYQEGLRTQAQHDLQVIRQLPRASFWNPLWMIDLSFVLVFSAAVLVATRFCRNRRMTKIAVLAAGVSILIVSQVAFVLFLKRMLEI